jgi:diadenylate cyclase
VSSRSRLDGDARLLGVLRQIAPGTPLREAIKRILRAETGALIVLGAPSQVQALFTGGFRIDVPFTPQRLSELAKMDGALVLDEAARNILWANVHLMPDPTIPTSETGTRHRTAERVAKQTKVPVLTVSESMHVLTLYLEDWRHVLEDVTEVLSRANQAVQTLEHYRSRFDEVADALTALELRGAVTERDALLPLARAEMLQRVATELELHVAELGGDGRLLQLRLEELTAGVDGQEELVVRDYLAARAGYGPAQVLGELSRRPPEDLLDLAKLGQVIELTAEPRRLDAPLAPRGHRMLAKLPQLPPAAAAGVVERFGSLKVIMSVSPEDLEEVEGVGPSLARSLREGLQRLRAAAVTERHG